MPVSSLFFLDPRLTTLVADCRQAKCSPRGGNIGVDRSRFGNQTAKQTVNAKVLSIADRLIYIIFSFEDVLKDGVVLCHLMNKIVPGSIKKIQEKGSNFQLMENIQRYVSLF